MGKVLHPCNNSSTIKAHTSMLQLDLHKGVIPASGQVLADSSIVPCGERCLFRKVCTGTFCTCVFVFRWEDKGKRRPNPGLAI